MINDCGQFQICNNVDRCIILEIVKLFLFYIYLQYTSDRQGVHTGRCEGTGDRGGGGGILPQGSQGVGVKWGGGVYRHKAVRG